MKKIVFLSHILFSVFFAFSAHAQSSLKSGLEIDQAWSKLYSESSYVTMMESYDPVFEVEIYDGEIDKEKCKKNYDALVSGAKKIPISISLNYWTYRCAAALDKKQDEEQYLQSFSLLAQHAFGQQSDSSLAKPIRVLHSSDIFSLVDASGNDLVDQYLDLERLGRYLPWVVVLLDNETKRQNTYTFDFLDVLSRTSDPKLGEYRAFRTALTRGLISKYQKQEWQVGMDAQGVLDVLAIQNTSAQLDVLKPLVLKGYKNASDFMITICLDTKDNACGQFVVDAMLDWLEQKDTASMVRMAALYSAGVGVKQDTDAALALLKSAEQLTGDNGTALRHFVTLHNKKPNILALPPKVLQFLDAEAFKKNKPMLLAPYLYMKAITSDITKVLTEYGDRLGAAAAAGNVDIYNLYSASFIVKGNKAEQIKWLEIAAKAGSARAQLNWAKYISSKDPPGEEKSVEWMLEAAKNGELEAIQWLINYYYKKEQWYEAAGWAESGLNMNDLRSGFQLAYIYILEPKGTGFTEMNAIEVLESISSQYDSAKARILWAALLMEGKSVKHDYVKAKALLLQDAEKNDVDAMTLLGKSLINGELQPKDEKAGLLWLEKAAGLGGKDAKGHVAGYLYYRDPSAENIVRAKKMWLEVAVKDSPSNINTFAWTLCTSSYSGYADAKTGLALMQLLDIKTLSVTYRDTYAACLAASNDFKQAVIQQQRAVDELGKNSKTDNDVLPGMKQRLALYQKSQIYTEVPDAK